MLDNVDQDTAVYIQDKAVNKVACVAGQKHCGRVQAPGLVVNLRQHWQVCDKVYAFEQEKLRYPFGEADIRAYYFIDVY